MITSKDETTQVTDEGDPAPPLTIREFSSKYPAWSEAAIRNLIYHSRPRKVYRGRHKANGFNEVIVRLGYRVLINEEKFFQWLKNKQLNDVRGEL